jgi:hypothetical protein
LHLQVEDADVPREVAFHLEDAGMLATNSTEPSLGAVLAAVVMIAGINLVHRQTTFHEDTWIGLLFVDMLGLGVILISRTPAHRGSLTAIPFGDALGLTRGDITFLAVATVIVALASILFYRHFLVLSSNEAKSPASTACADEWEMLFDGDLMARKAYERQVTFESCIRRPAVRGGPRRGAHHLRAHPHSWQLRSTRRAPSTDRQVTLGISLTVSLISAV